MWCAHATEPRNGTNNFDLSNRGYLGYGHLIVQWHLVYHCFVRMTQVVLTLAFLLGPLLD